MRNILIIFVLVFSKYFHFLAVEGNSSSNSVNEVSHCSARHFYCPNDNTCYPRQNRCTFNDSCSDSESCLSKGTFIVNSIYYVFLPWSHNNKDALILAPGAFHVLGYVESLPGTFGSIASRFDDWLFSRKRNKRRVNRFKHVLIRYRGFIYEFGRDYPAAEVDPLDPGSRYKYLSKNVDANEYVGLSECNRVHVLQFNDFWNKNRFQYHLTSNNCQDYYFGLKRFLLNNCTKFNEKQFDVEKYFSALLSESDENDECSTSTAFSCLFNVWRRVIWPNLFRRTSK